MKNMVLVMGLLIPAVFSGLAKGDPTVAAVTHSEFQAVNEDGEQTYTSSDSEKVILEGILLNNAGEMLDPTADDTVTTMYDMSGQWQIYFQGEGYDRAGTAVWMGQLYNNLPWFPPGYSNEEFIAELNRLNSARFSPGDRIRVTGYFLSYKGKNNINEQHNKAPDHDFTIELIERGVGLPRPEAASLDELKDGEDNFIFDASRASGGEYYQSRLAKIEGVYFEDATGWGPDGELVITDGLRTLTVKLGRGCGIYAGSNNLVEPFDVIGIIDQESTDLKGGYRMYVMDYDGNGSVLACREHRMADVPGDSDLDGRVDFFDLARLAEDWLK
ncbi:MAG: hypothetical protein JW720_07265 [Sedimentisphaerales bacterium]|nr:hypothetical protein [Sedimentisphaerales bacterium]